MGKLIKLSDTHYIFVDDSEIQRGMFIYESDTKLLNEASSIYVRNDKDFKITHSTKPLETVKIPDEETYMKGFQYIKPLSLSEVEEAIYGYSVEKMAEENGNNYAHSYNPDIFIEGFKAHQELVKDKLFSLATVEGCMMSIANWIVKNNITSGTEILTKMVEISESLLLPKTEWDVEFDEQGKMRLL